MAYSKARRLSDLITANAEQFITSAHITDTAITGTDIHSTFDLTGKTVTVATASAGDNDTSAASTAFVQQEIASLVDSAPGTLNTLNELAAALGDDANFSTTVTNSIAAKLPLTGGTLTGALTMSVSPTVNNARVLVQRSGDDASIAFANNASGTPSSHTWAIGYDHSASNGFAIAYSSSGIPSLTGNNLIQIGTSGNVGIGDTNPGEKLVVKGDGARMIISSADMEVAMLGRAGSSGTALDKGYLRLRNQGVTADGAVISAGGDSWLNAGNVGIGTTTPNQWASYTDSSATVFQVSDTGQRARVVINGGNGAHLDLVDHAGGTDDKHMNMAMDGGILKFGSLSDNGSAWVEQYILTMDISNGNVGVGTNAPEYILQVNGSNVSSGGGLATFGIFDTGTAYNGTNPGGGIAFRGKYNNAGSLTNFATVQGIKENTTDGNYASALRFTTRANGGNLTERMRIHSNGAVSIGNTRNYYGALNVESGVTSTNASGVDIKTSGTDKQIISFGDQNSISGELRLTNNVRITLGTSSNHPFTFYTNGVANERMRITADGRIGISNNGAAWVDANDKVIINGRTVSRGYGHSAMALGRYNSSASAGEAGTIMAFLHGGGGVGTISIDSSSTTYATTSDLRLKENIKTITDGSSKIMAMNPIMHTWKSDPEHDAVSGFIAQEMLDIIPESISGGDEEDKYYNMDYGRITPVIVAGLQDALKEIEKLKERINELETKE